MARLVALVGLPGAGKSTVTEVFLKQGYHRVYFGGITLEKLKETGKEINEGNERWMREKLRTDHGMAAFALLSIPAIEAALSEGNTIIDGLYSWEEYVLLKEKFPFMETTAVYAPPKLRYQRLAHRPERPLNEKEVKSREVSQIENVHQAGPIAMADWTFVNTGGEQELIKQVEEYIHG